MSPRLTTVILDYGGVVLPESADEWDVVGVRHGLLQGALWAAHHDIPEYGPSRRGEIGRDAYRAGVRAAVVRLVGETRAEAVLADFAAFRAAVPPVSPEMAAYLPALRRRAKLGLLSNAGAGALEHLRESGVAEQFDDVVCSGDFGLAKPDPAVFRLAAARLGAAPEECLFIDDMERHVVAARGVGMTALVYARVHHADRVREIDALLAGR